MFHSTVDTLQISLKMVTPANYLHSIDKKITANNQTY